MLFLVYGNRQGNTAWHQQRLALDAASRSTEHPRKAFINDLTKVIKTFQELNHDIIIGGDFNETLEDPNSGLLRLATNTNLSDPWYLQHPQHKQFATQEFGSKRIDSILISYRLSGSIRAIGYGPFGQVTNSDHRPLFVDFHSQALFGDDTAVLRPTLFRPFHSRDRQAVTTYIEHMYSYLQAHSVFELQQALDDNTQDISIVETVDSILGDSQTLAIAACRKRRRAANGGAFSMIRCWMIWNARRATATGPSASPPRGWRRPGRSRASPPPASHRWSGWA